MDVNPTFLHLFEGYYKVRSWAIVDCFRCNSQKESELAPKLGTCPLLAPGMSKKSKKLSMLDHWIGATHIWCSRFDITHIWIIWILPKQESHVNEWYCIYPSRRDVNHSTNTDVLGVKYGCFALHSLRVSVLQTLMKTSFKRYAFITR